MTAGLETFAKVRALHDRTDSPGEKTAAMLKMQTLARRAGMSVEQAMSKLDTPEPTIAASATFDTAKGFSDAFNDFFNTPEMRARRAEREAERVAKCRLLLDEYGTEDAVWADTEREAALRHACEPLLGQGETWRTIYRLDGWGSLDSPSRMPDSVRRAVTDAWPMPATVAEAWAEFAAGDKQDRDRCAFCPDYSPHSWAEARRYLLEGLCNTLPARSLNDIRARLSWMEHLNALEIAPDPAEERVRLATLRADIERMGARLKEEAAPVQNGQGEQRSADARENPPAGQVLSSPDLVSSSRSPKPGSGNTPSTSCVQNGQDEGAASPATPLRRTNADKRRDVLALLNAEDSGIAPLTYREIARRAGVSPQTVGNIRKAQR